MAGLIPENESERTKRIALAMNRHGYAFSNKVIEVASCLAEAGRSRWVFEAAEFPVEVGDYGTRIDFILWAHGTNYWMLSECKRVNPAFSDWFFLRTPYVRRDHHDRYVAEVAARSDAIFSSGGVSITTPNESDVFHFGFEVKTDKPGESSVKNAIEDAASQVCRGMNGMVMFLAQNPVYLGSAQRRLLLPVIFTTARLFGGTADPSEIDLKSGEIDYTKLQVTEKPFLYYQYHLSPGIKHKLHSRRIFQNFTPELTYVLQSEFIRTIPVVSASGIEQFLTLHSPDYFNVIDLSQ